MKREEAGGRLLGGGALSRRRCQGNRIQLEMGRSDRASTIATKQRDRDQCDEERYREYMYYIEHCTTRKASEPRKGRRPSGVVNRDESEKLTLFSRTLDGHQALSKRREGSGAHLLFTRKGGRDTDDDAAHSRAPLFLFLSRMRSISALRQRHYRKHPQAGLGEHRPTVAFVAEREARDTREGERDSVPVQYVPIYLL
ncbi:hypothetical protein MRX96_023901 [Rhipicephalus microplus]